MPFVGGATSAHSRHNLMFLRKIYLTATFWSFYTAGYEHIICTVATEQDYVYVKTSSGLPFAEVIWLKDLPTMKGLPVATGREVKRRFITGEWDFKYFFYSESDQVLMSRIPHIVYRYLDVNPPHLLIPHRLVAYATDIFTKVHQRQAVLTASPVDWLHRQCCLPRQNCESREEYVHVSEANPDHALSLLNVYGIPAIMGQGNFYKEKYRACKLSNADNASEFKTHCP
mmetsp:Transcript_33496/g.56183  ORF Transcript_33496/g.56183 Transcript_33496/m.56183 type:complete len:228 (-) Transcript_33496:1526-2209(-)